MLHRPFWRRSSPMTGIWHQHWGKDESPRPRAPTRIAVFPGWMSYDASVCSGSSHASSKLLFFFSFWYDWDFYSVKKYNWLPETAALSPSGLAKSGKNSTLQGTEEIFIFYSILFFLNFLRPLLFFFIKTQEDSSINRNKKIQSSLTRLKVQGGGADRIDLKPLEKLGKKLWRRFPSFNFQRKNFPTFSCPFPTIFIEFIHDLLLSFDTVLQASLKRRDFS